MTTPNQPTLARGPTADPSGEGSSSAELQLPARDLIWVGDVPELGGHHGSELDAASALADQVGFAWRSLAHALATSTPFVVDILRRMVAVFERSLASDFNPHRVFATVRIDHRSGYRQLQGAHVDWARMKEFLLEDWLPGAAYRPNPSLRSLERCHSIDCVVGGPSTEYFLAAQPAVLSLVQTESGRWAVEGVSFPDTGAASSGGPNTLIYRPPWTVHQFPSPHAWTGSDHTRLFVSCDYWG